MNKFGQKLVIATTLATSTLVSMQTQANVSANIGVTSNYIWRGMTQTSDKAAISGGMDYEHENGFAAGVWTSTVDFSGNDAGNETDLYASYSGSNGNLEYSVGAIYYMYSEYEESDFLEATLDLSYQAFNFGAAYLLDSDWDADGDLYYYVGAATEITEGFSAAMTLGMINPDEGDSGHYLQLDVSKENFTFSVVRASDELDNQEDTKFVVSWSKNF